MDAATGSCAPLLGLDDEPSSKESLDSRSDYDEVDEKTNQQRRKPPSWLPSRPLLLAHFSLVLLYTFAFIVAILYISTSSRSATFNGEDLLISSPLHPALKPQIRTVDYNFESTSPFKGPNTTLASIDAEWMHTLNGAHEVRVSPAQMHSANLSSITLADGTSDSIVSPIAYHMLHCLYTIHKYAHPDFYGADPAGPAWVATHTDHCVDNLRQFVQCHVGAGVSTFRWLPSRKIPWPVLSTREKCVDSEYFDSWVREHSVDVEAIMSMKGKDGRPMIVHPKLGPVTLADYDEKEMASHEAGHVLKLPRRSRALLPVIE